MNVYDFDKTIYKRDSTADFFFFTLRRHPKAIASVPVIIGAFVRYYILKRGTKTQFKEKLYRFLKYTDVKSEVRIFWQKNIKDIKRVYLNRRKKDDVVISASPEFLIKPVCEMLGVNNVIASRVDPFTGAYDGENCHGSEKVRRFREDYPAAEIDEFFSDSYSDAPLARLARRAYIVRREELTPWIFK